MTAAEQKLHADAAGYEQWLASPHAARGIAHLATIFRADGAMFRVDEAYNVQAAAVRDGQRQVVLMLRAAKAETTTTPTEDHGKTT